MKFAFTTCVQLGRSVMEKIYGMGGRFEFLVTLKDGKARDKSGRVYLDDFASAHEVPLIKVDNVNDGEVARAVKDRGVDWLFIIGWSQIAGEELLAAPKKGCIGMHPTLLPEGRGRASIPWAILKGLGRTGVTMFRLDSGTDTGDILGQVEIPLDNDTTATGLYDAVIKAHEILIERYWKDLLEDTVQLVPQDETRATEWLGRRPEDGELKPGMTVEEAERLVRAVTHPYPGAFYYDTFFPAGSRENTAGNSAGRLGRKTIVWKARIADRNTAGSIPFSNGYLLPLEVEERYEG